MQFISNALCSIEVAYQYTTIASVAVIILRPSPLAFLRNLIESVQLLLKILLTIWLSFDSKPSLATKFRNLRDLLVSA
jgi:hypothetical protein